MASAIQARSLASLMQSANSPPLQLPNASTTLPGFSEPLVLYIARVPGSRDVFLTPLKPKEKVVSAPDIESSLYFCHVDTEADDEMRSQLSSAGSFQEPTRSSAIQSLSSPSESDLAKRRLSQHRSQEPPYSKDGKGLQMPLALDSASIHPGLQYSSKKVPGEAPKPSLSIRRKPIGGDSRSSEVHQYQQEAPVLVELPASPVKLRGPRPMLPPRPTDPGPLSRSPGKENIRIQSQLDTIPKSEAKVLSESGNQRRGSTAYSSLADNFEKLSPYGTEQENRNRGKRRICVTLIRRDPGSGEQWNVGQLDVFKGEKRSSSSRRNSTTVQDENDGVRLEIANPGYTKFLAGQQARRQESKSPEEDSQPLFQRWLSLRPPRSPSSSRPPSSNRAGFHSQADLSSRRASWQQASFDASQQTSAPTLPAYTFISPWKSPCEFVTGLAGTTLKCRHFPSASSLYPMQSINNSQRNRTEAGSIVSELRFNLPATAILGKKSNSSFATPRSRAHSHDASITTASEFLDPKRASYRQQQQPSADDSWDEDNDADTLVEREYGTQRMDLSLGQELAGGGFSGKKAKLGKLIIQNEGLAMLDLVVAANLGFFWWARIDAASAHATSDGTRNPKHKKKSSKTHGATDEATNAAEEKKAKKKSKRKRETDAEPASEPAELAVHEVSERKLKKKSDRTAEGTGSTVPESDAGNVEIKKEKKEKKKRSKREPEGSEHGVEPTMSEREKSAAAPGEAGEDTMQIDVVEDAAEKEEVDEAHAPSQSPSSDSDSDPDPDPDSDPDATFESLYLRKVTQEFANDIDALRQAPDFQGKDSLDILIGALQQGVEVYPEEWRDRYMKERREGTERSKKEREAKNEGVEARWRRRD